MLRVSSPLTADQEKIVAEVVDCGVTVHRVLGPGFREKIYSRAFRLELDSRQLRFECEKPILVRYKDWTIPGQKVDPPGPSDLISEDYRFEVGLLMNFNAVVLKQGLQRVVN